MNRVLAILKNRMSLDWLSADLLCDQPPGDTDIRWKNLSTPLKNLCKNNFATN